MEFLSCLSQGPKLSGKEGGPDGSAQNQKGLAVLSIIKIALAADFARFENRSNAKTLIQELQTKNLPDTHSITRSTSLPPRRYTKSTASHPQKRQSQKSQPSKTVAPAKPAPQKPAPVQPPPPPATVKSSKHPSSEPTTKGLSLKANKKIHKFQEAKKDHSKRMPEPCLLTAAEGVKLGFGEKQKRKIRRMLLLRQTRNWTRPEGQRWEGRELRPQH